MCLVAVSAFDHHGARVDTCRDRNHRAFSAHSWQSLEAHQPRCALGQSRFVEIFHRRTDPRGNVYYWMDGELEQLGDTTDTDVEALKKGMVSLTPIWFDLTHHAALAHLRDWRLEKPV